LRAILPSDYDTIYAMEHEPINLALWRFRGSTPGPELSVKTLWDGILFQFAVVQKQTGDFIGMVNCHNADFQNGVANFALIARSSFHGTGLVLDGAFHALDYAFASFPLRKIYADCSEENLTQYQSAVGKVFEVEARLTDHFYRDGGFHDKVILSLTNTQWYEVRSRWETFAESPPA